MTWSAQLSRRSPPRLSRWRRCLPLEASTGLVPASAAKDAPLRIRLRSPLETSSWAPQTGSHAALLEQIRSDLGAERGECSLGLGQLLRQSPDALAEPPQHAVRNICTRPQPSGRLGESLPGEPSQTFAHVIGSGDQERAQLVEGGLARPHSSAPLDQAHAQVLAPPSAAGEAQVLAAEEPARGRSGVNELVLSASALLAARALALVHRDAGSLEETNESRAVPASALDGEGGYAKLLRPGEQPAVAGEGGRDLPAVEPCTERIHGDGDVDLLVRVHADCHRPLHDLASFSSRGSPGLDRAVSGKGRRLLSGHRPAETKQRRETGRIQGRTDSANMVVGHPAAASDFQSPVGQRRLGGEATQHG